MMFGGEQFAKIIGDFELAKSFKHAISEIIKDIETKDVEETREEKEERTRKRLAYAEERSRAREERIEQLSTNLIYKLSVFTESVQPHTSEAQALSNFMEITRLDIPHLIDAPYGDHLLHTIGYIYALKAKVWMTKLDSQEGHLGKRMLGFGKHVHSSWKERVHVVKETVKTVKCAVEWGQSMSRLAQAAGEEATASDEESSQHPFRHHSGHLEYEGHIPTESATSASLSRSHTNTTTSSPVKHNRSGKSSSLQPPAPLTEEEKRKLEVDTAAKSMEALWRATKLEIESVERDVCDRVLGDSSYSRETRRRRCVALLRMGELWQRARKDRTSSSSSSSP